MALIHWWPLNGNLNDFGTKTATLVNGGATVNTSGKIGNCYSFDGNDDCISISSQSLFDCFKGGSTPFSITMWIYNNESSGARGVLFGDYGTEGTIINFNIEINTGSISNNSIRFYWGNSPDWNANSSIISPNKWTHLSVIYDGTSIKVYIDGVLTNTRNGTLVSRSKTSGYFLLGRDGRTGATAFKGRLNDVRIYDHALSAKEVKEIAKGLVLHYNFEDPWIEPTTNIKPWSSTINSSTVAWDASLNDGSIAYSRQGWSNGYNAGVSAPTTGYHAHWVWENNDLVMKFPNLNSVIDKKGRWLGINGSMTIPWSANDKYTISWEQKTDNLSLAPFGGVYYKLTGSGSYNFHDGDPVFAYNTKLNTWQKVSHTFTAKSTFDGTSTTATLYVYGYNTTHEGTIYVRNVQIEYKDHVTPFVAETRPVGKVYDSSGYNNNSINAPSSLTISSDSVVGQYAAVFDNTKNSAIACGRSAMVTDAITVLCWAYISDWNNFNGRFISCTQSGGWNFEPVNSQLGWYVYVTGIGYVGCPLTISPISPGWHLIVGTFDGMVSKVYFDGILNNTVTGSSTKATIGYHSSNGIFIGAEASTSITTPTTPYFNGKLADVKIYATALSADDILAEYQRKAAIDKSGNMFTGEFIEDNSNAKLPAKKNQIITTDFVEGTDKVRIFGDYTQLEYLKSTGTEWIDSNVKSDKNTSVELELMFDSNQISTYPVLFGYHSNSSSTSSVQIYMNPKRVDFYGQHSYDFTFAQNTKYKLILSNGSFSINGINYATWTPTTSSTIGSYTMAIFAQKWTSTSITTTTPSIYKLYSMMIYSGTSLIRNFIPVKRNKDSVLGLFDLVECKFYTNSGTGTFTAGPEIGSMSVISANEIKEN